MAVTNTRRLAIQKRLTFVLAVEIMLVSVPTGRTEHMLPTQSTIVEESNTQSDLDMEATSKNAKKPIHQENFADAVATRWRLPNIAKKIHGSNYLNIAFGLGSLTTLARTNEKRREAEYFYRQSLFTQQNSVEFDRLDSALNYKNFPEAISPSQELILASTRAPINEFRDLDDPAQGYYLLGIRVDELINAGNYVEAINVLRTYLSSLANSRLLAATLLDLATLQLALGEYQDAEKSFRESLQHCREENPNEKDIEVRALNGIGLTYLRRNELHKAEDFFAKAYETSLLVPKASQVAIGQSLLYLGSLYLEQRMLGKAETSLLDSYRVLESKREGQHDLFVVINNLYFLRLLQGDFAEADSLLRQLLAMSAMLYGEGHPVRATSYYQAGAFYYYAHKDPAKTLLYTSLGLDAQTRFLRSQLPLLADSRRSSLLATIASQGQAAKWLYWWTLEYPGAVEHAFTHRINSHGQLVDLYRMQLLFSSKVGTNSGLVDRLRAVSRDLASITATPQQRERIKIEREQLEEQLFTRLPGVQLDPVTLDEISSLLPPNGVLIELQKYSEFLGDENRTDQVWGDEGYLAFLLRANQKPLVVRIEGSSVLDAAIKQALISSEGNLGNAEDDWEHVSELIFRPLKPYIANAQDLFISPDGELNRVPFTALPYPGRSTELFVSRQRLRLLSSGRDLIRFQQPAPPGQAPLVIANPSFTNDPAVIPALAGLARPAQRSGDLLQPEWDPLPGTANEGEQIAELLGTLPITGNRATVSLLERSRAPRILHIASHGFFVGDQDLVPDNPQQAILASNKPLQIFQGEDPLLRSGIVLAGANNPGLDPNDDGLLTAQEAAGLQLEGTELVVLSACSTAQGDLRTGEGVYGLQRALAMAGARSTLLSLWKVDDAATAEFMVRFYRRLKAGEGRADALAAVQAEFRSGVVKGPSGEVWSQPYYWAAWQLTGDWGPIPGL